MDNTNIIEKPSHRIFLLNTLLLTLLICIFRVPLLALFSAQKLTVLLNIIPLIVLFASVYFLKPVKKFNIYLSAIFAFTILYLVLSLIIIFFNDKSMFLTTVRELSSTTFFLAFPLLLDRFFTKDEVIKLIDRSLPWIISIAFLLTLGEFLLLKFQVYTIDQISIFLTTKATMKPTRLITFMSLGAIAIISITAYFVYLVHKSLKYFDDFKKTNWKYSILILIAFITILLSDSMTLILSSFLLAFLIIAAFLKNNFHKFKFTVLNCIVVIIIGLIFYKISAYLFVTTSLKDRYIGYFYKGELKIARDIWFPRIQECNLSTLISGFPVLENVRLKDYCTPGEFHSILLAFRYGFIPQLAWFLFFLIPVAYFFSNIKKIFQLPASFYACLAFLLPMVHYSGIEIWGNNYLVSLFIVVLLKDFKLNRLD